MWKITFIFLLNIIVIVVIDSSYNMLLYIDMFSQIPCLLIANDNRENKSWNYYIEEILNVSVQYLIAKYYTNFYNNVIILYLYILSIISNFYNKMQNS